MSEDGSGREEAPRARRNHRALRVLAASAAVFPLAVIAASPKKIVGGDDNLLLVAILTTAFHWTVAAVCVRCSIVELSAGRRGMLSAALFLYAGMCGVGSVLATVFGVSAGGGVAAAIAVGHALVAMVVAFIHVMDR